MRYKSNRKSVYHISGNICLLFRPFFSAYVDKRARFFQQDSDRCGKVFKKKTEGYSLAIVENGKKSEQVLSACETLNTYCQACVTYSMDVPVVVDKALISSWLSVDPEMNVSLDETAIREWMREFGKKYDTLGTSRMIITPARKNAVVSGGTYGWSINEEEETAALLTLIKNGEVVTKEPAYCQTAAIHGTQDWGSTYIEVDLSSQYMWYIENGTAAMECAVVTRKPDEITITPTGVYYISEKLSPSVLIEEIQADRKPEYETDVRYWMRITQNGIGFHDGDWQEAFGGDLYLYNGSHVCINMSVYDAQMLYSMIDISVPVMIHD